MIIHAHRIIPNLHSDLIGPWHALFNVRSSLSSHVTMYALILPLFQCTVNKYPVSVDPLYSHFVDNVRGKLNDGLFQKTLLEDYGSESIIVNGLAGYPEVVKAFPECTGYFKQLTDLYKQIYLEKAHPGTMSLIAKNFPWYVTTDITSDGLYAAIYQENRLYKTTVFPNPHPQGLDVAKWVRGELGFSAGQCPKPLTTSSLSFAKAFVPRPGFSGERATLLLDMISLSDAPDYIYSQIIQYFNRVDGQPQFVEKVERILGLADEDALRFYQFLLPKAPLTNDAVFARIQLIKSLTSKDPRFEKTLRLSDWNELRPFIMIRADSNTLPSVAEMVGRILKGQTLPVFEEPEAPPTKNLHGLLGGVRLSEISLHDLDQLLAKISNAPLSRDPVIPYLSEQYLLFADALLPWFKDPFEIYVGNSSSARASLIYLQSLLRMPVEHRTMLDGDWEELVRLLMIFQVAANAEGSLNETLVEALQDGDRILLPGQVYRHALGVEIIRKSENAYEVTIVNSGAGIEEHERVGDRWIYYQRFMADKQDLRDALFFHTPTITHHQIQSHFIRGTKASVSQDDTVTSQKSNSCTFKSVAYLIKWYLSRPPGGAKREDADLRYAWLKTWFMSDILPLVFELNSVHVRRPAPFDAYDKLKWKLQCECSFDHSTGYLKPLIRHAVLHRLGIALSGNGEYEKSMRDLLTKFMQIIQDDEQLKTCFQNNICQM